MVFSNYAVANVFVKVPAGHSSTLTRDKQRHVTEILYYGPGWTGAFYLRDYYKLVKLRELYTLTFFSLEFLQKAQLLVFGVEYRCNESIQCSSYVPEGPAHVDFCASWN